MRPEEEILQDINKIQHTNQRVCFWGVGKLGTGYGYLFALWLNMKPDFYCDSNPNFWGKLVKDNILCISPEQLEMKNVGACLILVGIRYLEEVKKQIQKVNKDIVIITYSELCCVKEVKEYFYQKECLYRDVHYEEKLKLLCQDTKRYVVRNPNKKKVAVYTCIAGKYDNVYEPEYVSEECDYYLISDSKPENLNVFQWIDLHKVVPEWVTDNVRKNRYCKISAYNMFSEYEYSIYIDGNIKITGDILPYLEHMGESGVAIFKHKHHQCIYSEGIRCVAAELDNEEVVRWQMQCYRDEGMPENFGQFECGILVRENRKCHKLMEMWWKEVFTRSYRDQLSFMYCVWKCGMTKTQIGVLGEDIRKSKEFSIQIVHR